jgi:hypothetical protein
MSTTSIKIERGVWRIARDSKATEEAKSDEGVSRQRQALETFVFLAVITILQRNFPGAGEVPGLPNLYWVPVLLASCQYGVTGGMVAAVAASLVYALGLSPQSAAQDFYAYARTVAIQPAAWLATALVIGGLRSLHIHQFSELGDDLAVCRRRASDLSDGLERATAEINALERRVAVDMSSVAALSRSLSQIDMSSRRAAAISLAELFRVGTGTGSFTVYLKEESVFAPVWAIAEDSPRSTNSIESLPATAIVNMLAESARNGLTDHIGEGRFGAGRFAVAMPPFNVDVGTAPLAAIVGELRESQDLRQFRRRAEELGRLFATILQAAPTSTPEARL